MDIRRNIVYVFILIGFSYLTYSILTLHLQKVDNQNTLKEKGIYQTVGNIILRGYRGKIVDNNNNLLAVELPLNDVVIDPLLLQKQLYGELAKTLKISVKTLKKKIKNRTSDKYLLLFKQLEQTNSIIINVRKLLKKNFYIKKIVNNKTIKNKQKIHGVFIKYRAKRYYPEGEIVAPLIGLTNGELNGIDGLEKIYNKTLSSKNGIKKVVFNARRKEPIADIKIVKSAKQGKDLALTIDKDIQYFAYRAVKKSVLKHKASSGSAIVLASNGDVLGLVNYPSTNPNFRNKYNAKNYYNHISLDTFDIASTIKPFVAMLAMQENQLKLSDKIVTGSKKRTLTLRLKRVLEISHNQSMIKIAEKLTKKQMWQMFYDLGFGEKSGLLPTIENIGKLHHYYSWSVSDKNAISYGYGLDANIAQLAKAYLVLANKGRIVNLNLIKDKKNPKGLQIFTEKIVNDMNRLLKSVVERGTAKAAKINNISVAGKTGTSRKYLKGKYHENKHRAIFVGLLPAEEPKYIMAVVIDEPKSDKLYGGGDVAAPVFNETMTSILRVKPI